MAEPVDGSHLLKSACPCGAVAYCAPGQENNVRCMDCRRDECGVDWPWFTPVGPHYPNAVPWRRPLSG